MIAPVRDLQDTVHMDGKRERHFRDGRRMVVFVNGTIKEEYPSGLSIVRFTNGDIKKAYKNGAHCTPSTSDPKASAPTVARSGDVRMIAGDHSDLPNPPEARI